MKRSLVVVLAAALGGLLLASCAAPAPTLSDEEVADIMKQREAGLEQLANMYGIDPDVPIPTLIRWVTVDDFNEVRTKCLRDSGIDATIDLDGGMSSEGNVFAIDFESLEKEFLELHLAQWGCTAKYSVDPRTAVPFTDGQYATLYHYFDAELRACLQERGFRVDPAPPLKEFVNDYVSGGNPWAPYDRVFQGELSDEMWAKLQTDCPRMPPFTELYGPLLPQP